VTSEFLTPVLHIYHQQAVEFSIHHSKNMHACLCTQAFVSYGVLLMFCVRAHVCIWLLVGLRQFNIGKSNRKPEA
jgi:hypothetical protein